MSSSTTNLGPADKAVLNSLRETVWATMPDAEYAETLEAVAKAGSIRNTAGLHRVLIEKAVTTVVKGDYVGHPFRGNQWSTAEGQSRGGAGGMATTSGRDGSAKSIMSWATGSGDPRLDGPTVKTRPIKWRDAEDSGELVGKDESGISYRIDQDSTTGEWRISITDHPKDTAVATEVLVNGNDLAASRKPKTEAEAKRMTKEVADRLAGGINDTRSRKELTARASVLEVSSPMAGDAVLGIANSKSPREAQTVIDRLTASARDPRATVEWDDALLQAVIAYRNRFGNEYTTPQTRT